MAMNMNLTRAVLVLALAVFQIATSLNPPEATAASEYVEAHNQARAEVGVKAVKWNQTLANLADLLVQHQRNRKGCDFATIRGSRYGVNQMWAKAEVMAPRAAVEEWVKQKAFYKHESNSCAKGRSCDVYTQLVWRDSHEVGCAQATCPKEGVTLTICHYKPAGNVVGESPY